MPHPAASLQPLSAPLPDVQPLRVVFHTAEPQLLPPFLGPALHGALGRALYTTVCAFPKRSSCSGCPIFARCAYPALFQTLAGAAESLRAAGIRDQAPRPLVLAPEPGWTRRSGNPFRLAAGAEVPIRLTLIGRAVADLPVVVVALQGVARRGLGIRDPQSAQSDRRRPGLDLVRITTADETHAMYEAASDRYTAPPSSTLPADGPPAGAVSVELVTPLRLKKAGRFLRRMEPVDLFSALARRANALSVIHGSGTPVVNEEEVARLAAKITTCEQRLRLVHVRRYSSSQQQRMEWPGVMGRLTWRGEALAALWPLLRWGERAQIGKATSFGFGRYRLTPDTTMMPPGSSRAPRSAIS